MNGKYLTANRFRQNILQRNLSVLLFFCAAFAARATVNLQYYNDPTISSSGQWGQNVNVYLSIQNAGSAASGTFGVQLTLNGYTWTTLTFPSINAGAVLSQTFPVPLPNPIPSGLPSTGSFSVAAKIIPDSNVAIIGNINITLPYPDLIGYNSSYYGCFGLSLYSAVWGQPIQVSYCIANQTPGSAGAFKVGIYISETNHFSANDPTHCMLMGTDSIASMPGDTYYGGPALHSGSVKFNLPEANPFNDANTTFYVGMVINPNNAIQETNTTNNANQGPYLDSAPNPLVVISNLIAAFRWNNGLSQDGSQDSIAPAGDGVLNLVKFAFNMIGTGQGQSANLSIPNTHSVGVSGTSGLPTAGMDGMGKLTLTYIQLTNTTTAGVSYKVEFSNDVSAGSWAANPSATSVTSAIINSNYERVTVTDSVTAIRRFARVLISEP